MGWVDTENKNFARAGLGRTKPVPLVIGKCIRPGLTEPSEKVRCGSGPKRMKSNPVQLDRSVLMKNKPEWPGPAKGSQSFKPVEPAKYWRFSMASSGRYKVRNCEGLNYEKTQNGILGKALFEIN